MRKKEQLLEDARVWLAADPEMKRHISGHEQIEKLAEEIIEETNTNTAN